MTTASAYLSPLPLSGKKKTYSEKLLSPHWQRKRNDVLTRDDYKCRDCSDCENTVHVHHLAYTWDRDPWDYPMDNFVTLCKDCHAKRHGLNIIPAPLAGDNEIPHSMQMLCMFCIRFSSLPNYIKEFPWEEMIGEPVGKDLLHKIIDPSLHYEPTTDEHSFLKKWGQESLRCVSEASVKIYWLDYADSRLKALLKPIKISIITRLANRYPCDDLLARRSAVASLQKLIEEARK